MMVWSNEKSDGWCSNYAVFLSSTSSCMAGFRAHPLSERVLLQIN